MSLSALLQATTVFGIIPIVDFVSQTDREDLSAVSRVIFDFITSIGFSVSMISLGATLVVVILLRVLINFLENYFRFKTIYDYLKISLFHYLGNWSIGSKERFLNDYDKKVPLYQELVKSSGPINLPSKLTLKFAQIIFVLFLFILTAHTFYIFHKFFKVNVNKSLFINTSIIFLIQSYLLFIGFTNVSTPRYLMVVYPLIILSNMNFINYFYNKKINKTGY